MIVIYRGKRNAGETIVTVERDGDVYDLVHHVRHSPTGFEWGYGGSGPADLSRSILWDYLGEEPPTSMYQKLKFAVIAKFSRDEWELTGGQLRAWLNEQFPDLEERLEDWRALVEWDKAVDVGDGIDLTTVREMVSAGGREALFARLDRAMATYHARQSRAEHPDGYFEKGNLWFPSGSEWQSCCGSIRFPSRRWPYSLMIHCRSDRHIAHLYDVPESLLRSALRLDSSHEAVDRHYGPLARFEVDEDELRAAAKSRKRITKIILAIHPKTPADVLEKLAISDDEVIRTAVRAHPNCPPHIKVIATL